MFINTDDISEETLQLFYKLSDSDSIKYKKTIDQIKNILKNE